MKVKINTHGNALPEVHGEWIDLCTAEDVTLDFLEYKIISLGVSIEIPAGYYAHVVPRSSTFGKWGILLANSMGVIENDYCGDGDVWGYEITFNEDENTTADLLDGKITFHQYITPFTPAEDIEDIIEFDPDALSAALN